ncbi:hypothetical protein AN191_06035 [Loktanella sp. 5RATIMAR09]|uniref:hypothetical protein n=1 Tax=Loktanella sp. 5RATIMAR09 TaxID=1225655 RepID=UPI0006EB607D|nr:hypothetical protein [Loktanella sp. 5RATIMAR09]KQI72574.1 hypothetical protein AN191_06035 [Loktanella sp. 5RATIMAR09]
MKTATKTSLLFLGAIGLAGCDGPAEPFEFATTFDSFEDYGALSAFADALVDEDGLRTTDDIAQPDNFATAGTGTTSYTGAILTDTRPTDSETSRLLVGQLQLDVAFSTDTITGYAGNFIYEDNEALNGTLIGNGGFVRVSEQDPDNADVFSPHFTDMNLVGGLSGPNGEAYDANIALTGYFLADGTNPDSPVDSIAGIAVFDFGTTGPAFETGIFAASD